MPNAIGNGEVLAESEDSVGSGGNRYFRLDAVDREYGVEVLSARTVAASGADLRVELFGTKAVVQVCRSVNEVCKEGW